MEMQGTYENESDWKIFTFSFQRQAREGTHMSIFTMEEEFSIGRHGWSLCFQNVMISPELCSYRECILYCPYMKKLTHRLVCDGTSQKPFSV